VARLAVIRAARIEAPRSGLGRDILASADFAAPLGGALVSAGRVALKDIGGEHEVFAPAAP
jgi:hypothetical protein